MQGEQNKTTHDNNKDFNMKGSWKVARTNSFLPVTKFALHLLSSPSWAPAAKPTSFHRPTEAILAKPRVQSLPGTFLVHSQGLLLPKSWRCEVKPQGQHYKGQQLWLSTLDSHEKLSGSSSSTSHESANRRPQEFKNTVSAGDFPGHI